MGTTSWWAGVLTGVVSAVVGAFAWQAIQSDPGPPADALSEDATALQELRDEVQALRKRLDEKPPQPVLRTSEPTPAPTHGREDVRTLLPADMSDARVEAAGRRAAQIKARAEAAARGAAAQAAREAREAAEKERRFLEDKARGGTMAMLRALKEEKVHAFDLVASPEDFAKHFERRTSGPRLTDQTWSPREPLEDGSTVLLASGIHRWDVAGYQHRASFPEDVLIEGNGMDETLLVLNELSSRKEIRSLTFKDLTIDCSNNYFTDLRRDEPVTISMENVRVVGFDMGAGGSVMLAARTAAFYAKNCRFEAGYARTQAGHGNLFRVRSGLLVRIEDSTFVGPFRSVYDQDRAATYVFSGCTFEQMRAHMKKAFEAPGQGVRFENSTWTFLEPGSKPAKRRLKEINPRWP